MKDDFITLRDEEEPIELFKTTYKKMIIDVEIFTLDYEINKETVLIIPFRWALRGKLFGSCNLRVDDVTYANMNRKRAPAIKKVTLEVNKTESVSHKRSDSVLSKQFISVSHSIYAYYA